MSRERRREARYVVEGLRLEVDDRAADILDVSVSGVRLFHDDGPAPALARLHFVNEPGWPTLDETVDGALVRQALYEVVYAYVPPAPDWDGRLRRFDAFSAVRASRVRV